VAGNVRARYTPEFKQEAVRLVRGGQSLSSVASGLGVSTQSIENWVKSDAVGGLKEAKGKPVNADQMEIARLKAELAKTRMERDILKKRRRILRGIRGEIRLYRANDSVWPITMQCRVLDVSASGYHQHRTRSKAPDQPARIRDMALLVHIRAVFAEMKGAYGWPRTWRELTARGVPVGKERVRRLMKANALHARGKHKFKATTNSNHALPVSPDLLKRNFSTPEPGLDRRHHLCPDGRGLVVSWLAPSFVDTRFRLS
jgi:putative transposase